MFSINKLFTLVTALAALAATSLLLSSSSSSQVIMVNAFSVNNIKTTTPTRTQTYSQNLPQPISVLRYKTNEDEDGSSNKVVSTKTAKTAVKKIKQDLVQRTAETAAEAETATETAAPSAAPIPTTNGKTNSRVTGRSNPIKNIIEIETLDKFRECMDENKDVKLIVVRFYATWCKTCKKTQPFFFRFARRNPDITFINIPYTQDNWTLHEALNVSSVPFGHIYHSTKLVEEMNLNDWSIFERTIVGYHTKP